MTSKILKSTERGQITLPKQWRERNAADHYVVHMHKDKLVIVPLQIDVEEDEEVIFNADRDNNGKGISLDSMISMLKKVRHG